MEGFPFSSEEEDDSQEEEERCFPALVGGSPPLVMPRPPILRENDFAGAVLDDALSYGAVSE
jgi:hypothetical protein